jgi:hypothetical protein
MTVVWDRNKDEAVKAEAYSMALATLMVCREMLNAVSEERVSE